MADPKTLPVPTWADITDEATTSTPSESTAVQHGPLLHSTLTAYALDTPAPQFTVSRAVKIDESLLLDTVRRYDHTAALFYFMGRTPTIQAFRTWVLAKLSPLGISVVDVSYLGKSYFLLLTETENMRARLLAQQFFFDRQFVYVQRWKPEFTIHAKYRQKIPVWIEFPQLPLFCRTLPVVRQLAASLGEILLAPPAIQMVQAANPRFCILWDLEEKPPEILFIELTQGTFWVSVIFKNLPGRCFSCYQPGHMAANCHLRSSTRPSPSRPDSRPAQPTQPATDSVPSPTTSMPSPTTATPQVTPPRTVAFQTPAVPPHAHFTAEKRRPVTTVPGPPTAQQAGFEHPHKRKHSSGLVAPMIADHPQSSASLLQGPPAALRTVTITNQFDVLADETMATADPTSIPISVILPDA